jgi:hypothetical protein
MIIHENMPLEQSDKDQLFFPELWGCLIVYKNLYGK